MFQKSNHAVKREIRENPVNCVHGFVDNFLGHSPMLRFLLALRCGICNDSGMEKGKKKKLKRTVNRRWFVDLLHDRGISQRQLAFKIGLDPAAVSLMFSGKRGMRPEEAESIVRPCQATIDDAEIEWATPVLWMRPLLPLTIIHFFLQNLIDKIGRASCRERDKSYVV